MSVPVAPERVEAALRRWLDAHGLASYDPYDGLACAWPWSNVRRSRLLSRVWTQWIKRSPVNVRPLFGIHPHLSAKSLVDLAATALVRQRLGDDPQARDAAAQHLRALRACVLPGYAGACWGMPTPYVTRYIVAAPGTPNLFWSVCAAGTFLDAFELQGDAQALAVARSVFDFVHDDLGCVDEGEGGVWFRYFPGHGAAVFNVAALTGTMLLRLARHTGEADLERLGRRALHFVLQNQNRDGSWYYARGVHGRWVDGFHTGYILESLAQAAFLDGPGAPPGLDASLQRGIAFYQEHLFTRDHLPCYWADRLHPLEVQNCAQAIQTLAVLAGKDRGGVEMARRVATAVIASLFRTTRRGEDEAGYFVMSRGRWLTNPLPAVRWGLAPMLRALTVLRAVTQGLSPWTAEPRL